MDNFIKIMAFHNTYNKKNIVEEYKKRFQQILEFTTPNSSMVTTGGLNEEGEEPVEGDVDPSAMGGDPGATGPDGEMDPMGGDPSAMGPDGGMDPMGGDQAQADDLTSGFNPQGSDPSAMGPDGGMDPMGGGPGMDTMQPDDEVVDITELTDAQEETLEGVEEFNEKFVKALKAIKSIETLINKNNEHINAKIADIENEIKRRNPTATEKMSNRQSVSYPYTISPEEYWKDKEKTSNYSTENDNNGKEQEQYVITNADVNGATDWKSISDSLDDNILYNQTLNNILKF